VNDAADHPAPVDARRKLHLSFDRDSDVKPYLISGWSRPEGQHTWSVGPESTLVMPSPGFRRRAMLSLTGWPNLQPGWITRQRIMVTVNGTDLGRLVMSGRQTVTAIIPRQALSGQDSLTITLRHPDAARPGDYPHGVDGEMRELGVAYQAMSIEEMDGDIAKLTGQIRRVIRKPAAKRHLEAAPSLPPEDAKREAARFLHRFQSLGDDCEFGMVQRHAGIEPLGLFRFSQIGLEDVTRGFDTGFAGLAEAENFEIVEYKKVPGHDYMGRDRHYGMLYHTARLPGDIDPALLKAQEMLRLRFMARKILEDAALPDQIFVVKRKQRPIPEEIGRLLMALENRGPSRLLWVCEATGDIPPGTAERVIANLVVAYVDRIDVAPLQHVSLESWIAACRAAWMVFQQNAVEA
jgi:hypothetical protein